MTVGYAASQYYQEALRQGQKEYKNCVHRGLCPNIQTLERGALQCARMALGVLEIPIYLVVGSTEEQRCGCFSPGFYPLMDLDTEFAAKWIALCGAQMEEGIREPIKCYEYLGRFYVSEGNKRVSVLRTLGSATVHADVTRLLPADEDNAAVRIYREFLEFYRCAGCYGVHFSEEGRYARLQAAFGFSRDEVWPEELQRKFRAHFFTFRDCFYAKGGAATGLTTGDALLRWLRFYSAGEFLEMNEAEYRQTLGAVWKEFQSDPIDMSLAPREDGKKSGSLLPFSKPKRLRVAFLFQSTPADSAWTAAHDRGREALEAALPESVTVWSCYGVTEENAEGLLRRAAEEGAELIFTTAVTMLDAALRVAVKYPKVRVMNCSIDQPYVNVKSYYCRVYEGKFITGAIAGAMSRSGRIGYVGSYPILGVPASINAFALGASLTNPDARVELGWHCLPGDCVDRFRREGIELVSDRDYLPGQAAGAQGLTRFGPDGEPVPLASPSWDWGEFYIRIVRELLQDPRRIPLAEDSGKPINYWWGMSSGVVDLSFSSALPEGVLTLAQILRQGVRAGVIQPFRRTIRAQDGRLINDGTRDLSMEEILRMDWLCDRVDGAIPAYEELLPVARSTVRRLGVDRWRIPPEEGAT